MSSVASHVHATSSFTSPAQPQIAGSTPDNDGDPFSALLDAVAAGQDAATTPAPAQQASQPAATPPNGSAAANAPTDTADTSPASSAPDARPADGNADASATTGTPATPPTAALIFAATTGGKLVQAAAAKFAKADKPPGSDIPSSAPTGNKGKSGATSLADKLNSLLGAAGGGNNAAAQTQASTASPAATPNANTPANQAAPGATDVAGIIAAVRAALAGPNGAAAASNATDKPSASSQNSKHDGSNSAQDTGSTTDANATAAAQQLAVQPIAAAITINNPIVAQQTSGKASADIKVGGVAKSPIKLAMALADGRDATPAPAAKDNASAVQAQAATNPQASQQASANDPSNTPAPDSTDTQQNQPADGAAPASTSGNVLPATGDQPAPRAEAIGAAAAPAASGGQTGSAIAKVDGSGLANFGITAAAASAPAAATTAPAAAANGSNTVPVAGLAVAIASRVQAGSSQFDIRLDPPELGRIEVRLGVDRDGRVTSHITVDRADTLQLLQSQQPQLQQSLDQAGLKTADNGLQFSLRDQSFANQNNNGGNSPQQQNTPALVIPDADLPPVQSAQIYNRLGLSSGIDIRV